LPAPSPSSFGVEAQEDVVRLQRHLRPQPFGGTRTHRVSSTRSGGRSPTSLV
jgi:hypothetical protein